ncbi:hypothetical protein ACO0LL_08960 [Undibacterium sp. TC4M20W]
MTTSNDELLARIERLEGQHASYHSLLTKLTNREWVLRCAVMALIYHAPPGVLSEDFSMFLNQVASSIPPDMQCPDVWEDIVSAVEDSRKPHPAV